MVKNGTRIITKKGVLSLSLKYFSIAHQLEKSNFESVKIGFLDFERYDR